MLETTTNFLLQFTEINVVLLVAFGLFAKSMVDIMKVILPSSKPLLVLWAMSFILGTLLVVAGKVGAIILAIVIVAVNIAKIATGDHEQTKSSIQKEEDEELPDYHG